MIPKPFLNMMEKHSEYKMKAWKKKSIPLKKLLKKLENLTLKENKKIILISIY
jgi:hypothetical protein